MLYLIYILYILSIVGRLSTLGSGVGGREVQVTGDVLAEAEEGLLAQHLGNDVGELVLGRDVDEFDRPLLDVFPQEVMSHVDVFCSLDGGDIVGDDLLCGGVVLVHHTWSAYLDSHRPQQHVESDNLFDGERQSHVLRLTRPCCHRRDRFTIHGCC